VSGRRTATSDHFRDRIDLALPCGDQKNLLARGIAEDIVNIGCAIELEEAWPTNVWAPDEAGAKKDAQFRHLLRRVLSEVFNNGRHFFHVEHDFYLFRRWEHIRFSLVKT